MRRLAFALVVIGLAFGPPPGPSRAARGPDGSTRAGQAIVDLVVFERAECTYCEAFRTTVAARYIDTPTAARAPLRYVDIDKIEPGQLALAGAVTVLPTIVIMRDGREVDRIVGLFGHREFVRMVQFALQKFE